MIRHLHSWLNFPEILCMFKEIFCEDIPISSFGSRNWTLKGGLTLLILQICMKSGC